MFGIMLTLFSTIREPGVAMQCTKSINPRTVLAVFLILAMLLQEGFLNL